MSLRLFLPESWTDDVARMAQGGVTERFQSYRTKPEIAVEEIDRADVQLIFPVSARGRPRVRHVPDVKSRVAHAMLEEAKWGTTELR